MSRIFTIIALITALLIIVVLIFFNRPGKIDLVISPVAANVTIDGQPYGEIQSTTVKLSPGKHNFIISRDGYFEENRMVDLQKAENLEINIVLTKIPQQDKEQEGHPQTQIVFSNLISEGYAVIEARFFSNNTWVVGILDSGSDPSAVVLVHQNSTWQVVVGPGTNFSTNIKNQVPIDVYNYLAEKKYVF